jgi:phosphate:Na+ symporter
MLGANVGTTLIVQVLAFNISAAAPLLFVLGLVAFRSGGRSRLKDLGRVAIGLGLMLLALHILLDTLAPAEEAPSVRALLKLITSDPIFCVLVATVLTWAAHSSVATVLLTMSLAFSQFVTPAAALALVLGANLGSAINPVLEGARRDDPASSIGSHWATYLTDYSVSVSHCLSSSTSPTRPSASSPTWRG